MSEDESRAVDALEAFLLGAPATLTRGQVAERAGVPLDLAEELWHHLGFAHHGDEDLAFAESDVEALATSVELVSLGILSGDSQAALVRTWGRSFARLADWQVSLLAGLVVEGPDQGARLAELAAEVLPRVEALQAYVWRRHLASAASRLLTDADSLHETESRMAVCFVDIVGYTAHTKTLDDHELVGWIERFERESTGLVVDHGGRVIKTIGDEILFTVDDPAAAVEVALELTRRGVDEDDPFPQVRAGIAYGPVVRRLGDVYGPVVNIAARLTTFARPGTVVADEGAHDAVVGDEEDEDGPRWRRLRRVSVKGYSRLDAWRISSA